MQKIKNFIKSFTAIELIVSIAILSLLTAAVLVAINPLRRLQEARNARRWIEIGSILDAVKEYQIRNGGTLPAEVSGELQMLGTDTTGCNLPCGTEGLQTVFLRVSGDNNDAEEQSPPNGNMYMDSTDLELIRDGSRDQEVGMRFTGVAIPQSATIIRAYLEFTVDELNSETTHLVFYGEASDSAEIFTPSQGNITQRPKTSAAVSWNNIPPWTRYGDRIQTPDLTPVIQEIINRPTWNAGNAIVILVDGTGERTAESFDGVAQSAPLLAVEYTAENTEGACLNLEAALTPYLNPIPEDPAIGTAEKTYYAVKTVEPTGIKAMACTPERGEVIELVR